MKKNVKIYNLPLVSVIIPVYNACDYIEISLRSIYNQTYDNIEIIVIDDGSVDNTNVIIERLSSEMLNLNSFRQNNSGISSALNFGLSKCRGKYIARMDADDISLPHRIEEQVKFLELNKDVHVVSSSYIAFDDVSGARNLISHPSDPNIIRLLLSYCSPICHPAVMARASVYKKFRYDPTVAAEDHKLWCEMTLYFNISNIDQPLLMYRKSPLSLSKRKLVTIRWQTVRNGYLYFFKSQKQIKKIKFNEIRDHSKFFKNIRWLPAYFYWIISKIVNIFIYER